MQSPNPGTNAIKIEGGTLDSHRIVPTKDIALQGNTPGSSTPATNTSKPNKNPVIRMLASAAKADPHLKEILEQVAASKATPTQVKQFQSHVAIMQSARKSLAGSASQGSSQVRVVATRVERGKDKLIAHHSISSSELDNTAKVGDLKDRVELPPQTVTDILQHDMSVSSTPTRSGCDFCRKRATQCTGGPPCENCVSHGLSCFYGTTRPPNNLPTEFEAKETTQNSTSIQRERSLSMDSDAPIPMKASHYRNQKTRKLPQVVSERLKEWYIKNGEGIPPCATKDNDLPPTEHHDGRAALWKHKSGEILTVSSHNLPRLQNLSDSSKCILIAQGPTFGPHIVHYHATGDGKTLHYKIWLGVNGNQKGFEASASVLKGLAVDKPKQEQRVSTEKLQDAGRTTPGSIYDLRSESTSTSASIHASKLASSTVQHADDLPTALNLQLEDWYAKNGRHMPPCVCTNGERMITYVFGKAAAWKHESGEAMSARLYRVTGFMYTEKRLIVVHGATKGPYIISFCSARGASGHKYKIWLGIDGDVKGNEKKASIYKYRAARSLTDQPVVPSKEIEDKWAFESPGRPQKSIKDTTKSDERIGSEIRNNRKRKRGSQEYADDGGDIIQVAPTSKTRSQRKASMVDAPPQTQPLQTFHTPIPANETSDLDLQHTSLRINKNSQLLGSVALRTAAGPAANASSARTDTPALSYGQKPPMITAAITSLSVQAGLKVYILSHATFMFHNSDGKILRSKAFAFCNTVNKLFNQARVAKIFRNEGYLTLALRIEGEMEPTCIAEGDTEDFDTFVTTLTNYKSWETDAAGTVKGECTVVIEEFMDR